MAHGSWLAGALGTFIDLHKVVRPLPSLLRSALCPPHGSKPHDLL